MGHRVCVLQLTGALQSRSDKRYVSSVPARHVVPWRSLIPRLLLIWMSSFIVATSPFVWFHLMSGGGLSTTEAAILTAENQSKFRKLALCVFVLSFAIQAAGVLIAYLLLLRTWITTRHTDRSVSHLSTVAVTSIGDM